MAARLTTIKNYTTLKLGKEDWIYRFWFDYHKELHYSQTVPVKNNPAPGLTTIKNYTTLKRFLDLVLLLFGLTTIKNYTTLKQRQRNSRI